jgi:hypothetical protein
MEDFAQPEMPPPPPPPPAYAKPKRTRRRNPVNCTFCRKRKLKCDRQQPCSNCVKRDLSSSCVYVGDHKTKGIDRQLDHITPPEEKLKFTDFVEKLSDVEQATQLRQQLDKMEMLVLGMLQEKTDNSLDGASSSKAKTSIETKSAAGFNSEKTRESLGMLQVESSGKAAYHGDTHWVSMLSEIQQLEEVLRSVKLSSEENNINISEAMTFDQNEEEFTPLPVLTSKTFKTTPIDALKTIPTRAVCDFLVTRFFQLMNPCFQLIHQPTFEIEYKRFWENPSNCELVWMCMLFLMITMALQSYLEEDLPSIFQGNSKKTQELWLQSAEVCGVYGRLTYKPSLINLKCLILWVFVQSDMRTKLNWLEQVSLTVTMAVRMSQAMGLHRDPTFFSLSPFEMEERRRIWHIVHYMDMAFSIGRGLPTQIVPNGYDTKHPSNINNAELMPNYEHPPMPYHSAIQTHSSYSIYRAKLLALLTEILDFSSGMGPLASVDKYEQTWEYHRKVENVYLETPSFLSTSVLDCDMSLTSPGDLVQMMWFEIEYLRTIIILHRKYGTRHTVRFDKNGDNTRFLKSRHEMMKASLRTIEILYWSTFKENNVRGIYGKLTWLFFFQPFLHTALFSAMTLSDNFDDYTPMQQEEYIRIIRNSVIIFEKNKEYTGACDRVELVLKAIIKTMNDVSKMTKEQRAERARKKVAEKRKLNTFSFTDGNLALAGCGVQSFVSLGEGGVYHDQKFKSQYSKMSSSGIWDLPSDMKETGDIGCNAPDSSDRSNTDVPINMHFTPATDEFSPNTPVADMVDQCTNNTLESNIDNMLSGILDMDEFDPFYVASQFQFNHGWNQ